MVSLSVVIPSYNNGSVLRETLNSIFDNIQEIRQKFSFFEVLLCDNVSKDDTKEIVIEYEKKYAEMRYYLNKKHVWGCLNIISSVVKAKGDYVWIIGDDKIYASAFPKIADVIEKQNPDMIWLPKEVWDYNIEETQVIDPLGKANGLIDAGNLKYRQNFDFIGNIIIKKRLWEAELKTDYLYKTFFPHAFVFIKNIDKVKTYRIQDEHLMVQRGGGAKSTIEKKGTVVLYYLLIRVDHICAISQGFNDIKKENRSKLLRFMKKYIQDGALGFLNVGFFGRMYIAGRTMKYFNAPSLKWKLAKFLLILHLVFPRLLITFRVFIRGLERFSSGRREAYLVKNEVPKYGDISQL